MTSPAKSTAHTLFYEGSVVTRYMQFGAEVQGWVMVKVGRFGGLWVGVRLGCRVSGFTISVAYKVRVSDF